MSKPKTIQEYVMTYTQRGMCRCGECIDAVELPLDELKNHTNIHTTEVGFFDVAMKEVDGEMPTKERFLELLKETRGAFGEVDMFDGEEHGYMELGGFFGDQQIALLAMGLGKLLGCWQLLTPKAILGKLIPEELQMQMAQQGMVTIKAEKQGVAANA